MVKIPGMFTKVFNLIFYLGKLHYPILLRRLKCESFNRMYKEMCYLESLIWIFLKANLEFNLRASCSPTLILRSPCWTNNWSIWTFTSIFTKPSTADWPGALLSTQSSLVPKSWTKFMQKYKKLSECCWRHLKNIAKLLSDMDIHGWWGNCVTDFVQNIDIPWIIIALYGW